MHGHHAKIALRNPRIAFPMPFPLLYYKRHRVRTDACLYASTLRILYYTEVFNMNIGLLLIAIIGGAAGIASTLYLLFSFPVIIIWKIYRKIAKGIPLTK